MAFSTDSDLVAIVPDILDLGIDTFIDEHAKAEADIRREIRKTWWPRTGNAGEMNDALIIETQWTRASAYLVLWKYALPQLTNWVDGDRFRLMIDFYRDLHAQEMVAIFADGVQYDFDEDGTIQNDEQDIFIDARLTR